MADVESRPVRVLTVPSAELLSALQPLPEGIRAVLWDLDGEPEGAELSLIHI